MARLSIVVEGRKDAEILRKVLPPDDLRAVRFFAAQGRISLSTIARNILVHEGGPVLVVLDSDTLNSDAADENRQNTKAMISHVAGPVALEVFSFLPEIEIMFFEASGLLEKRLGRPLAEAELARGKASPRQTLALLAGGGGADSALAELIASLDEQDGAALRGSPQMAALMETLHELAEAPNAPHLLTASA